MKTIKILILILGLCTTLACTEQSEEIKPLTIETQSPSGGEDPNCKKDCG